ncbi:MAG: hypothetical protein M1379_09055 [Firmicutes bacterium]|nr:hypothetical protein [Bacillota bacterium]
MCARRVIAHRKSLRWPGFLLLIPVFLLLVLPISVLAEEGTPEAGILEAGAPEEGIGVELGKVVILRVHYGTPDLSPYDRAAEITRRLNDAAWFYRQDGALNPDQVRVAAEQGETVIYLGDRLIVTVDEAHARMNLSSQETLAQEWAENLKAAIASYNEILGPKP